MGDRAVLKIEQSNDSVGLYSHWDGVGLLYLFQQALATPEAQNRLDDPQYLTRIIFQAILDRDGFNETGYGIFVGDICDGEYDPIIYTKDKYILFGPNRWTVKGFLEADIDSYVSSYFEEYDKLGSTPIYQDKKETPLISDYLFRQILNVHMSNDLESEKLNGVTQEIVDYESRVRGFDSWVVAYHEFVEEEK